MPDVSSLRAVPSGERDKFIPYAQAGIVCLLTLSGLIRNIAPEGEVESLLLIAGGANYKEACAYKWAKVNVRFSFFQEGSPVRVSTSTAIFIPGGKIFSSDKDGAIDCKIAAGTYNCTITTPWLQYSLPFVPAW